MELYKIIAQCVNEAYAPHTFDFVPENFEGVKILQKFGWQNPMGFTPKFSVSTMRAIKEDKEYIDNAFDDWGAETKVEIKIYKLNVDGDDHELQSTFMVDIDTYSKTNDYTEFALKSISVIDDYNLIKNTDLNFSDTATATIPQTKAYINLVSLGRKHNDIIEPNKLTFRFQKNNEPKIYNKDSALYDRGFVDGYDPAQNVYTFNRNNNGVTTIAVTASGSISIFTNEFATEPTFYITLYKNDYSTPILTLFSGVGGMDGRTDMIVDMPKTVETGVNFADNDVFFIGVTCDNAGCVFTEIIGNFFVDLYVETEIIANRYGRYLRYTTAEVLLNAFFKDNVTIEESLKGMGIVSENQIINSSSTITLKPKDFLNDFCIATGSIVNFLPDGAVEVAKMNTYFTQLLSMANAIEVVYFKDLSIGYDTELSFISLSAGMGPRNYETYTYFIDWNKVLSFNQPLRNSSENLDLTLSKFRVDFSGIIDGAQKISGKTSGTTAKDLFLFDPTFTDRGADQPHVYDVFTPRDIIENWYAFLNSCFHGIIAERLFLVSNGGTPDNLTINGKGQLDYIPLSNNAIKILPLKVSFTGLIPAIDFSKKILKITNDGEEMFIFVTECETTDNLDEQKIKGNLIFFPEES